MLVAFYPYAFSGVCTGELTGFRDRLGDFETDGSTLLTISCDPIYTQRALADRDGIFFPLLSDFWPHGAVSAAYGVFDATQGCAERSSFVIDPAGVVRWALHNERGLAVTSTSRPSTLPGRPVRPSPPGPFRAGFLREGWDFAPRDAMMVLLRPLVTRDASGRSFFVPRRTPP